MSINKIIASAVVSVGLLCGTAASAAGVCGVGVVTEVREGGFNGNDLYVRVDADPEGTAVDTLHRTLWVRYMKDTLTPERLNAIRSLAYLAFASGKPVYTYSHTAEGCRNATELSLYDESAGFDPRANGTANEYLPN